MVYLPIFILNGSTVLIFNPNYFGMQNFLVYSNLENYSGFMLVLEVIFLVLVNFLGKSSILTKTLLSSFIIISLSVNFNLIEFFIFLQVFYISLLRYSAFDYEITLKNITFKKLPNINFVCIYVIVSLSTLFYLFFLFPITDVFYLKLIELGPIGRINKAFYQMNILSEFSLLIYFTLTVSLSIFLPLLLKREKNFNQN